jgi:ribosomal-protein-alanine N-acetyltransferase
MQPDAASPASGEQAGERAATSEPTQQPGGPQAAAPEGLGVADAAALAALEGACFPDAWDAPAFAAALARPHVRAYGIRDGDNLAAYGVFHFLGDEFEVINIAVDPARRGQRLGSRLFGHVLQQADKAGMLQGHLEVRAGNEPAKRLYLRHGFAVVGVRKRYYPDTGEDALVMRRTAGQGASANT